MGLIGDTVSCPALRHLAYFFSLDGVSLLYAPPSRADSCVLFHKRAPVRAACGRVINIAGDRLSNVELTLADESGAVLFTTRSDSKGFFSFGSIPKGDYTLRVEAPSYHVAQRELQVTRSNQQKCSLKIEITLGFGSCDTGTRVKGVDKPSDLDTDVHK